jgi:ribonuclease HI
VIAQLREGLGIATNNAAEYRALILGLTYAAKKGFKYIRAQGDSKLVCNQVSDVWRARHDTMADLCKRVKEIKGRFHTFQINHVLREFNTDADAQANLAVELPVGEVQEQANFL